jgi:hypothetical protein
MNPSNYMEYRDIQYEKINIGYDEQYPEGGIKCKNYELCRTVLPPDHWEQCANYLCMTCGDWFKVGGFGWNELEFRESDEECSVCLEKSKKQLKFPTNCGHWFCISCSRNILFYDESRYHLSPVPYGCPLCPNNCVNPIKGKQCYCEEYTEIQDKWEQDFPLEFKKWNDSEHFSMEQGETIPGSVFGSCICPLCKKKYIRNR